MYYSGLNNICIGKINKDLFSTYLYFDINPLPKNIELISAKLILFKTPSKFNNNNISKFQIAPTKDFLSRYNYNCKSLPIYNSLLSEFKINDKSNFIKIDLKKTINSYINNKINNKGLLLFSSNYNYNHLLEFVSPLSQYKQLRPFIEIKYIYSDNLFSEENSPIFKLPIKIDII